MKQNTKIAVIGGSGKSGKYLVKELLNQGFECKLLLRNRQILHENNPLIEIVKGDARSFEAIEDLIHGCSAVISVLGQPHGESSIFSTSTKNVIRAMKKQGIKRYILTTGLNVDTPLDNKGEKAQLATCWMKTNFPETTFDKQAEFELLTKSGLDWTLVRLPVIDLSDDRREMYISLVDCPGEKISAADLACFLISQLSDNEFIKKAPFIANK